MGNDSQVQWVSVRTTSGLYQADMMSAELRRFGIPARVVQESAGAALGLSTGKLGEVTLQVPAGKEEAARALLAQFDLTDTELPREQDADFYSDPDEGVPLPDEYSDDGPDLFSRISRGALVVAAVAFSPAGVIMAVIGSWLSDRNDQ